MTNNNKDIKGLTSIAQGTSFNPAFTSKRVLRAIAGVFGLLTTLYIFINNMVPGDDKSDDKLVQQDATMPTADPSLLTLNNNQAPPLHFLRGSKNKQPNSDVTDELLYDLQQTQSYEKNNVDPNSSDYAEQRITEYVEDFIEGLHLDATEYDEHNLTTISTNPSKQLLLK